MGGSLTVKTTTLTYNQKKDSDWAEVGRNSSGGHPKAYSYGRIYGTFNTGVAAATWAGRAIYSVSANNFRGRTKSSSQKKFGIHLTSAAGNNARSYLGDYWTTSWASNGSSWKTNTFSHAFTAAAITSLTSALQSNGGTFYFGLSEWHGTNDRTFRIQYSPSNNWSITINWDNYPTGSISVSNIGTTSATLTYSITANDTASWTARTVGGTSVSANSGSVSKTGLSVNTSYTHSLVVSGRTTNGVVFSNRTLASVTYKTLNITACGQPTSVTIAYIGNGKLRVSWSGASGGTSNSIRSYHVGISTSSGGSFAQSTTVTTTATSGTADFTVNNATAYYGAVRTQGSAGSSYYSAYKWTTSTAKGTGAHPTVSQYSVITKAQMDSLRAYKKAGTAVTQYAVITATVGNTYRAATAATSITAAWYNGA